MKLASVQALKQELLSIPATLVESAVASRSVSAFAASTEIGDRSMRGIALGVTGQKQKYRLAVRLQRSGPLVSAMTEQIRKRASGEVDVRYVGGIVKFVNETKPAFYRRRRRPLRIGSSISDVQDEFISAGTLGCFVVRRTAPYYIGALTNNHVIANENGNPIGSTVVQPGTLDDETPAGSQVGELGKVIKLRKQGANFIDAAIADIHDEIEIETRRIGNLGNVRGLGNTAGLGEHATVYKVGRTTGQTKGRITAFDVDNVRVEYDLGELRFDNQIEIEGTGSRAFSDSGDSGSLIVDGDLRAIGLLFAGGEEGGSNGKGLTYANPLGTVLDTLNVDLEL